MIRRIALLFITSVVLLISAELRAGQQIWQDASLQARAVNSKINLFDESILTRQKDVLEILELHLKDEMHDLDNLKERADEYKRDKLNG